VSGDSLQVRSPLSGWCADLEDSPDPAFSGKLLGDGVSIDPTLGELRAPFDGEVLTVPDTLHAVNLRAKNGAEFLIHIGIDTVKMGGKGFEAHVAAGDTVSCGQLLLRFDLEEVLRSAVSLRTPVLLLNSDRFEISDMARPGPLNTGDLLFTVVPLALQITAEMVSSDGSRVSRTVSVGLEHGIHARPAAALIEAISGLQARVVCQMEDQAAEARSPVALMSLGVTRGDVVTVTASGPDSETALDAFVGLLEPGDVEPGPALQVAPEVPEADIVPPEDGAVLRAQPASPGLAMGASFHLREAGETVRASAGSIGDELSALDSARERVRNHLARLSGSDDETHAGIARAHLALLDDPLITEAADGLARLGHPAGEAWQHAIDTAVESLGKVSDARLRERVDDLLDINLRMQRALAGEDPGSGPKLPDGCIVLASNLLPSQLIEMDRERVRGICLSGGGVTSHVAILAISLEIPMLVAAGATLLAVEDGSILLVDADLGELEVRPADERVRAFADRSENESRRQAEDLANAREACLTTDGQRIHFNANIASAADARKAVENGAEGCGLLRTEFLFMGRSREPGIEEQLAVYREISKALGERPMVVRTLDAGGAKPLSCIRHHEEDNPALGIRGLRLGLEHPELLDNQLAALMNLQHAEPLQVMIPMVSSVHEVEAVRETVYRLRGSMLETGTFRLGVMIETPAAALIADRLATMVDFFSIGTNDLTQYTLCMDRGEPRLANRLDPLHPAVLELIHKTADAAETAGIPAAVCGGAAGDPLAAPVLVGLGIRELSMPGSLIARQKAHLRRFSMDQCRQLAAASLAMRSAREVRAMMREVISTAPLAPETGIST
jgi:phosphocarrier protein FPr/phosphocarrier protein